MRLSQYSYLRLVFFIMSIFSVQGLVGQGTFQPKKLDNTPVGILYDKEVNINVRLHTHGFAMGFSIGKIKTFYKTTFYEFEIGSLRHPKEYRQSIDYQTGFNGRASRNYVYGKRNSLLTVRGGIGAKRYFTEKAKRKGIAAGISYVVGPTLGLQKPYYLEFFQTENGRQFISTQKYSEENRVLFLSDQTIFGAAPFSKGFKEIKFVPGAHAKAAVHLDWGSMDEFIKVIEAGFMLDVFIKEIPIMVEDERIKSENRPFFLNLFLNIQFGRRS